MIAPNPPKSAVARSVHDGSYVDWTAILAGAVFAYALVTVLATFGAGLGLSMVSPNPQDGVSLRWFSIAAGVWFIWITITSFAAGGYLAGRMRRPIGDATADEIETRDGTHGLVVWAVGAVFAVVMGVSGLTSVIGSAASGIGSATSTLAETMDGPIDYAASVALRSENGALASDSAAREEITSVFSRSLQQGEVTEQDRTYLASVIANNTDLTQADARAQLDAAIVQAEQSWQNAVDAANQARIVGVIAAFVLAATMLVSAAAAYFAASAGGRHRDENLSFRTFGR